MNTTFVVMEMLQSPDMGHQGVHKHIELLVASAPLHLSPAHTVLGLHGAHTHFTPQHITSHHSTPHESTPRSAHLELALLSHTEGNSFS